MIHLDTSVLVRALSGDEGSALELRQVIERGERVSLTTIALYEWLRGPRTTAELEAQEALLPRESAVPFGSEEAVVAADLYGSVSRPRGREIDLAIAACALTHGAAFWTLNPRDFQDIPDLRLYLPDA